MFNLFKNLVQVFVPIVKVLLPIIKPIIQPVIDAVQTVVQTVQTVINQPPSSAPPQAQPPADVPQDTAPKPKPAPKKPKPVEVAPDIGEVSQAAFDDGAAAGPARAKPKPRKEEGDLSTLLPGIQVPFDVLESVIDSPLARLTIQTIRLEPKIVGAVIRATSSLEAALNMIFAYAGDDEDEDAKAIQVLEWYKRRQETDEVWDTEEVEFRHKDSKPRKFQDDYLDPDRDVPLRKPPGDDRTSSMQLGGQIDILTRSDTTAICSDLPSDLLKGVPNAGAACEDYVNFVKAIGREPTYQELFGILIYTEFGDVRPGVQTVFLDPSRTEKEERDVYADLVEGMVRQYYELTDSKGVFQTPEQLFEFLGGIEGWYGSDTTKLTLIHKIIQAGGLPEDIDQFISDVNQKDYWRKYAVPQIIEAYNKATAIRDRDAWGGEDWTKGYVAGQPARWGNVKDLSGLDYLYWIDTPSGGKDYPFFIVQPPP